jgi:hypothetical protein
VLLNRSLDARPHACVLPGTEVVIDGAPGRELARKEPPLAAGAQHIKDRVQDCAELRRAWPSTWQRWRQEWCKQHPRCIGQLRGIAGRLWQSPVSGQMILSLLKHPLTRPGARSWLSPQIRWARFTGRIRGKRELSGEERWTVLLKFP